MDAPAAPGFECVTISCAAEILGDQPYVMWAGG